MPETETAKFSKFFEKFERQTGKQECRFKFHDVMKKNKWSEEFYQKLLLAVEHFNEFNKTAFSEKVTYNPIQFFKKTWWSEEMPEGYKPKKPEGKPEEKPTSRDIEIPWDKENALKEAAIKCRKKNPGCPGVAEREVEGVNIIIRLYRDENKKCGHCPIIEELDLDRCFNVV